MGHTTEGHEQCQELAWQLDVKVDLLNSLIIFKSQVELGDLQAAAFRAGRNGRTRAVPSLRRLTCSAAVIVGVSGFSRMAQPSLIWKTLQVSVSWQVTRLLLATPARVCKIHPLSSLCCTQSHRRAG